MKATNEQVHGSAPAYIPPSPGFTRRPLSDAFSLRSLRPESLKLQIKKSQCPCKRAVILATVGMERSRTSDRKPEDVGEQLVRAAMLEDVETVAEALANGAEPNFPSSRGQSNMTALMWAASNGNVDITSMLLSAGLTREDINARNNSNYTAILYCFEGMPSANPRPAPPSGFPNSMNLNKKIPPQVKVEKKITGHSSCAKLLLMNGADLFAVNMYNEGLLHLAARKGQLDWLRILVSKGLPLNARNNGYLHTPTILAAIENHADCVRFLCQQEGSDINAQNISGWTALMWAAATGSVEAVQVLLECNADPNIFGDGSTSPEGQTSRTTPLKEARKCGEAATVSKLLIRAGATE